MSGNGFKPIDFRELYAGFDAPIAAFDCGKKCAPHNPSGKPFCCDICVAVPTVYNPEWNYLKENTNLWHRWSPKDCDSVPPEEYAEEKARLEEDLPDSMILVACLGPDQCQRDYRGITCRQFPFFPYITSSGEFIGMSYYWEYQEQCWVISNLQIVSPEYRAQFIATFDIIFERMPDELENYSDHSEYMRDEFNKLRRAIPLLHRDGHAYKISSHNERMRRVPVESMPKFGPYKLAAQMPFPDEVAA